MYLFVLWWETCWIRARGAQEVTGLIFFCDYQDSCCLTAKRATTSMCEHFFDIHVSFERRSLSRIKMTVRWNFFWPLTLLFSKLFRFLQRLRLCVQLKWTTALNSGHLPSFWLRKLFYDRLPKFFCNDNCLNRAQIIEWAKCFRGDRLSTTTDPATVRACLAGLESDARTHCRHCWYHHWSSPSDSSWLPQQMLTPEQN